MSACVNSTPRRRKRFEQAALALTAVVTRVGINPAIAVQVNCEMTDLELLFVDWLNMIIYEMSVREMLFDRLVVMIEGTRLEEHCWSSLSMLRGTRRPASPRASDRVAAAGADPWLRWQRQKSSHESPPIQAYWQSAGKSPFDWECVVGPGGLEPPTKRL
jgi:hypothetical protein